VHGYSALDVELILPCTDPRQASTSYNVVYIRLQCRVQGCASILQIRTLMAFDKCPHEEVTAILVSSYCSCDCLWQWPHPKRPIVASGLAFDARFDEDWEIGEGWNRRAPPRLCA
jgi:hypothetical protein